MDERQPLNRGDADAQAGEGTGAGGDRVEIDVLDRQAVCGQQIREIARQTLGVRARRVAGALLHERAVAPEGATAGLGGGVESENDHCYTRRRTQATF